MSNRFTKSERQANRTKEHRTECARIMRHLRNAVKPGETFTLPNDASFWRTSCAVSYLGWTQHGKGGDEVVTATRPS